MVLVNSQNWQIFLVFLLNFFVILQLQTQGHSLDNQLPSNDPVL